MNTKAQEFKKLGNEAYKKRKFSTAIGYYEKATEIDPNEITYYNNIAAVCFEQKNYDRCITWCKKAVEIGRKNQAHFTNIAKSLARMGKSYRKCGDLKNAKAKYEAAVEEHSTSDYRLSLLEIENEIGKYLSFIRKIGKFNTLFHNT